MLLRRCLYVEDCLLDGRTDAPGTVASLIALEEKLRRSVFIGILGRGDAGFELLRLRLWPRTRAIFGGSASPGDCGKAGTASDREVLCTPSPREGMGGEFLALLRDSLPCVCRTESRVAANRTPSVDFRFSSTGFSGKRGICGGPRPDCARKDNAVSHRKCRSRLGAVNFNARSGVKIRIDLSHGVSVVPDLGSGVSSLTSSTDLIVTAVQVSIQSYSGRHRTHACARFSRVKRCQSLVALNST